MNAIKTAKFVLLTLKSYSFRFSILPAIMFVTIIITLNTGNVGQILLFLTAILFLCTALFSVYPFYASDKVPQLYAVLPQRRSDLVQGLYLVFVLFAAVDVAVSLAFSLLVAATGAAVYFFLIAGVSLFAASFIVGVEFPVMFRFGYIKSQYLFVVFISAICFLPGVLAKFALVHGVLNWFSGRLGFFDGPWFFLCCVAAGAAVLGVSYSASLSIYRKKDI